MSTFDKNMEKIFDVAPVEATEKPLVPIKQTTDENMDLKQDLSDAYEQTKSNLQDIIDNGKQAMDELYEIAKAGQHPRAFEVYGGLMKNLLDANKELLNIQKQMRTMDEVKKNAGGTKIDNALFVGSTAELSKFLKGNKE